VRSENKKLATEFLYAYARNDLDTAIQFVSPDVEFVDLQGCVYGIDRAGWFLEPRDDGYDFELEFGKRKMKEIEERVIELSMTWDGPLSDHLMTSTLPDDMDPLWKAGAAHLRLLPRRQDHPSRGA
jgi:hypothetical protein